MGRQRQREMTGMRRETWLERAFSGNVGTVYEAKQKNSGKGIGRGVMRQGTVLERNRSPGFDVNINAQSPAHNHNYGPPQYHHDRKQYHHDASHHSRKSKKDKSRWRRKVKKGWDNSWFGRRESWGGTVYLK